MCPAPTDARAIIKSWKKSDVRYSEMAVTLDDALAVLSDVTFLQIERSTVIIKWRADPKSPRAAIQAILAKDPKPHTVIQTSMP